MERMNSKQHANSSPPALNAATTNDNNNDVANAVNDGNAADKGPQCLVREQDQYMPIANVIRIMRRILPPHAKISDDAKETIQECVSEYIAFVTGEANERCQREQRKTVTAEDVLWAMGKLGFDNYVEPLTVFLHKYRESENGERSSLRGDYVKRERMDYGPAGPQMAIMPPPPPYGPGFSMGPHGHPMFDPSMVGLFRDGTGSGSSSGAGGGGGSSSSVVQAQNSAWGFDPFASFK